MLANVRQKTIKPVITAAVAPGALVHTDEYSIYAKGENQLSKVVQGVTFRNGVEVIDTPDQNAA